MAQEVRRENAGMVLQKGLRPLDFGEWLRVAVRLALACGLAAVLLFVFFVAVLALTLSATSDQRITAQLKRGLERGVMERASYPRSPYGHIGHSYDMFTDCIAFGTNLNNADVGLWERIAASPYVGSGGRSVSGSCEMLADGLAENTAKADLPYLRFWQGYQTYTRSLLSITSLENLRRTTALLLYGVLLFCVYRLARVFGPWTWPIVLLPFFGVGDFLVLPLIVSHAVPMVWIWLSVIGVLLILQRAPGPYTLLLPVFVFSAGAILNFVSMLLNPPFAPALMALLVIADGIEREGRATWETVLYAGVLSFLWFAGYVVAWALKWLLAGVVLGRETVISDLASTTGKYSALDTSQALSFLDATWRNLSLNSFVLVSEAAAFALAIMAVAWVMMYRRGTRQDVWDFLALLSPLLVIVAWVEGNRAHSAWHSGYVSRSFVLFSVIPLLAAAFVWRRSSERPSRSLTKPAIA